jgi:hypothetical protein
LSAGKANIPKGRFISKGSYQMKNRVLFAAIGWVVCCGFGCGVKVNTDENPFLQDMSNKGKEDTGYINPDGIEVEVDLEADVEASSYRLFDAPAELGQFALTYLRKRGEFYLESLAEDASSDRRVDWWVDGNWISAEQARQVGTEKLRHFRIRGVNAVLLFDASQGLAVGKVFPAKVPLNPYNAMSQAGDTCADPDSHLGMSESIYWYLWNPDKAGCSISTQSMTVTISKLFQSGKVAYPEYDQLVADSKITVVILFGQIGDSPISDSDIGVSNFNQMSRWLTQGGFVESKDTSLGMRFSKRVGSVDLIIDLYSPYDFSGLGDMGHFSNFQKALSEHEIIAYDGHSMLGASDFWSQPSYPAFYQIFLYGGCLGYEYYVRPILQGKKGWEKVDIMSSVVEVSASANDFAAPFLAKLIWALDHEYKVSWSDLLRVVREHVGDSTFGASGVRDNCFSPGGSLCQPVDPDPGNVKRYENNTSSAIPDGDPAGMVSTLSVQDSLVAKTVTLELELAHSWVGDLKITLEHDGRSALIWDQAGGSAKEINQSFLLETFSNRNISGTWSLKMIDLAEQDTGTLNRWALVVVP